ncbi:MAG TPA: DUF364 domain-containing protein [Anaeromyxobacter sp.]|nr:DUF364 domain-containing protein [Anaeromyxobacter sp.]
MSSSGAGGSAAGASGPWSLYERLLDALPAEAAVRRVLVGRAWTLVEAQGLGMAMSHDDDESEASLQPPYAGRPLRQLAAGLRSWNVREAAIGLAAVNSHYNDRARVEQAFGRRLPERNDETVFQFLLPELVGRRVAVIGHFPGLEPLAARCRLTILERRPQPGDLPDFAAEYLLPEQDWVFITGVTLVNKTLPRLLELSRRAKVVLVGPSVPLTPRWFEWGVSVVAGSVAVDPARVWEAAGEGGVRDIWGRGAVTVQFRAEERPR